MPIIFENSGERDIRAFTTYGVNVKSSDSAIGYFGTGFKIATGVLLRLGQKIQLQIGTEVYDFTAKPIEISDKEFSIVCLNEKELSFTTDVGKNWKMWMAYREFYCNATDEAGHVYKSSSVPSPRAGTTRVIVWGSDFEQVHYEKPKFILESKPIEELDYVDIHAGGANAMFYRGIKVVDLKEPSLFTYNIKGQIELTEDRTMAQQFEISWAISRAIRDSTNADYIRTIARAYTTECAEAGINFADHFRPNDTFMEIVGEIARNSFVSIPDNIYKLYRRRSVNPTEHRRIELTQQEKEMLEAAIDFCVRRNYPIRDYELKFTDGLGLGVLGAVIENSIWISREAFERGTHMLVSTLIEEYIHRHYKIKDFTREMQEHLLNKLIHLGEELDREAL